MRFICLPGAFGNAKTFSVQLAPLVEELESDDAAKFCFTQGSFETSPPPGFENYFGSGPHYRFTPPEDTNEGTVLNVVRALPKGNTPEEVMRLVLNHLSHRLKHTLVSESIEKIFQTIDEEGDIEGIIGYSEGAMIAATLILEEQRRCRERGSTPKIKCAVFISGWPPIDLTTGDLILADESDGVIDIPTCHVMGASDPMVQGSMALYNLCDPDQAELFDHGHGHLVPREERALKELGEVVRELIASA